MLNLGSSGHGSCWSREMGRCLGNVEQGDGEPRTLHGQVTQVPLSQISRMGYRRRANETDDAAPDKAIDRAMVLLRTEIALP